MSKSEAQTRKELIDVRLAQAGWFVDDPSQVVLEYDIPVENPSGKNYASDKQAPYGFQYSDYVLLGSTGKPLAVVEAKKTTVDARRGKEQARQYAYNIQKDLGCDLPFCFYTNGYDIYFWDLGNYPPRKIYGFPTRNDLEQWDVLRRNRTPLAQELINTEIVERPYQMQAIRTVMEQIEKKHRKFLLVMATGTGKTRTAIALVDALMKAGWLKRVLFLVDRIALRNQAREAFQEHTPNLSTWPNEGEKEFVTNRRVYISTYPSMLNVIENKSNTLSPHFFDLIIVDESHRSIYNVYQNILNYFNAIVLGLTATPTDAIDHNTFDIFECEDGLPTFAYSYEDAVNNRPPFLSDFQVLKVSTKFQEKGIHQGSISLDDQKRLIAQGIEPEEINFEGSDLERKVSNAGTNTLIVREFMEECIKDPTGVLPGKSIFFCMTKKHARRIEDIFDKLYPEHAGVLARVIVSDDPRVYGREGLLEQFKKQDMPRVAISVDMLDTGIDIPELVNLAFAKPVFSYTKFWQMIGRGTRLLNPRKMKSWCLIKDNFLVIDYWDNFEYFKLNPKGKEVKSQVALPVKLFKFRVSKLQLAKEKNESALVEKTIRELKAMLELLPEKSVVVLEAKADLVRTQEAGFWDILRPEHFQFLEKTIAPVLRAVSGVDFEAMRFEKDVVEASVALLRTDQKELDRLAEVVCAQIAELPLNIYLVEKEEELIRQALTPHFWATLTEEKLDSLIEKLAPLMRFRQSLLPPEEEAQLNLKDLLYHKSTVEFGPEREMVSISRYKELVEKTVRQMATSNLVMQKLKQGEDLTEQEIKILADELSQRDPYVTEPLLQKVYDNRKAKFIQFIRYILGLEELLTFTEVVTAIFDDFLHQHTDLSSKQIQFLEILKSFLIDKGKVAKKDLVSAPFTQLHPDGILGIFPAQTIEEIISLTEKIVA